MEKLYIYHRAHTEWQWPISGVHSIVMENQPWLVRLGGCTHTPSPYLFTLFTITYKVAVNALAERADTLQLFHLYSYMYSLLYVRVERVYRTQMSKDRVTTLNGIFPQLSWRKGGHVMYCDGSFKVLVVPIAMAELFSCKLLSTPWLLGYCKLYFTLHYIKENH